MSEAGKGDKTRVRDFKRYRDKYDAIFGNKKTKTNDNNKNKNNRSKNRRKIKFK